MPGSLLLPVAASVPPCVFHTSVLLGAPRLDLLRHFAGSAARTEFSASLESKQSLLLYVGPGDACARQVGRDRRGEGPVERTIQPL